MKNVRFYQLLRRVTDARGQPVWTVERIAEAIYCGRVTVSDALNNKARRGRRTRPKLVKFFKKQFPELEAPAQVPNWRELLAVLGWDEAGTVREVPCGKLHVEHSQP